MIVILVITIMGKIIYVEGARNVGKTHLIKSLDTNLVYKFPYNEYYNNLYLKVENKDKFEANSDKQLFYFNIGSDISVLDLTKQGFIDKPIVWDRGIFSTFVFGIQSKRITLEEALENIEWIKQHYGNLFDIVYIKNSLQKEDERNKDMWSFYKKNETDSIYLELFKKSNTEVKIINNNFKFENILEFNNIINSLLI